jgi:hypothetical protein
MPSVTARKPQEDFNWDVLGPLGLIGLVLLLSVKFVGARPFNLDNDSSAQVLQFAIAGAALWVMAWGYQLARQGRPAHKQVLRDRLLVVLGASAFFGYFNFGHLHFNNFVHVWDTYHYYMGAKYFPEVGYEYLYDCAAVADAESGRADEVRRRTFTDLRTNIIVKSDAVLAKPQDCKQRFTPERWEAFKKDINTFRSFVNETRWKEIHLDHGYNATPVWTLAGIVLTNTGPASMAQLTRLNLLDPLYLALTLLVIWWAFGPRAFAVAALVLGTNFPNRFYWTGGAFLRHDWLFYLVASICLLKKDKPFLAGFAFAYATLLRLFPGLVAIGPAIAAFEYFRVHKKLDPRFLKYVAGGAVGTAVLFGSSLAFLGGLETWEKFKANTVKHANTPLTNHMGLRTLLSWRPDTIGQKTVQSGAIDPWAKWKATRLEKWHQALPLFVLIFAGSIVLVWLALKQSGPEPWLAAALGIGFIVVGAELTNYYYCFLAGIALLHSQRREVGMMIATLAMVTQFINWHPLPWMSGWLDEQYVTMTLATLFAVWGIAWLFTKWGVEAAIAPEPEPAIIFAGPALTPKEARVKSEKKKSKKRNR